MSDPILRVVCAGWLTDTWLGREITIAYTDKATLLAVQQHPTAHRTILTTATPHGVQRMDVRDDTHVTYQDPAYTSGEMFGGAL